MNHSFNALLNVHSIKSRSFSLIRLCVNVVYTHVVYRVEKSYVNYAFESVKLHKCHLNRNLAGNEPLD